MINKYMFGLRVQVLLLTIDIVFHHWFWFLAVFVLFHLMTQIKGLSLFDLWSLNAP